MASRSWRCRSSSSLVAAAAAAAAAVAASASSSCCCCIFCCCLRNLSSSSKEGVGVGGGVFVSFGAAPNPLFFAFGKPMAPLLAPPAGSLVSISANSLSKTAFRVRN